ncbi:MAG TPA: phosphoglucosamine mutase [Acidobacteriota bacterium]|nr:phosphoglucosamine mutase [Acidobacteriota bacterium]
MKELKIGTSWVRGVVGDALTPELIVNFACAFGTWCDGGAVVIGRDTRRSSATLRAATIAGLLSTGCEVIDMGVCPSPVLSFAVRELGADGGISITGSHNDARWNALKFIGPDGALLNAVKSEEVIDLYHGSSFLLAPWDKIKPVAADNRVLERYLEHLLVALDVELIRARHFRVAVDFCNGACAPIAARFLERLGCTLLPVNEELTGEFPHPPAPSVANMRQLASILRWLPADIGAAINVDGDRIGLVTSGGVALSEEYTLPLAAGIRLKRRPGPVATNLSTSSMIEVVARELGQKVIRTSVGESHVIDEGLAEGAVLAGEGSGGVAALPSTMTFDALLTLGFILEQMALCGESLASLVDRLPRYVMRKRQMGCQPNLIYKVLDRFRVRYADQSPNCTDGVRVAWSDAWLHVRASNTEPLLRIIVEADAAERADSILDDAMTFAHRITYGHGG